MARKKVVAVEFPPEMSRSEIAEKLRRIRSPAETEEQRAKSAARVEVESRSLAELLEHAKRLDERVHVLEGLDERRVYAEQWKDYVTRTEEVLARLTQKTLELSDDLLALAEEMRSRDATTEIRGQEFTNELRGSLTKFKHSVATSLQHIRKRLETLEATEETDDD